MLRRELLQGSLTTLISLFSLNIFKENNLTVESLKIITKEVFDDYDRTPNSEYLESHFQNFPTSSSFIVKRSNSSIVEDNWNELLLEINKTFPKIKVYEMKQILVKNRFKVLKCDVLWKGHKDHFYDYIGVARVALQFEIGTRSIE